MSRETHHPLAEGQASWVPELDEMLPILERQFRKLEDKLALAVEKKNENMIQDTEARMTGLQHLIAEIKSKKAKPGDLTQMESDELNKRRLMN